jgi:hypothetical protein
MGSANLRQNREQLDLAQQIGRMHGKYPELKIALHRNEGSWTGVWWPHTLSDRYQIRVSYSVGRRPKIAILEPELRLAVGKVKLPHTYGDGQMDICVHRPDEWTPAFYIADTIMPWVSQWLRFYEVWEQTGSWEGEGTHPEARSHERRQV